MGLQVGLTCFQSGLDGFLVLAKQTLSTFVRPYWMTPPNQINFAQNGVIVIRVFRLGPLTPIRQPPSYVYQPNNFLPSCSTGCG